MTIWSAWVGEGGDIQCPGGRTEGEGLSRRESSRPPPAAPAPSWSQRSPDLSLAPASQVAPPEAFFLTRAHALAHPHVYMHTRASQRPAHTASVHTPSFPPQSLIRTHLSWDTHSLIHSTHTCVHVCSTPTHAPQNPSRSIWGPHGPAQERQVPLSRSPSRAGGGGGGGLEFQPLPLCLSFSSTAPTESRGHPWVVVEAPDAASSWGSLRPSEHWDRMSVLLQPGVLWRRCRDAGSQGTLVP